MELTAYNQAMTGREQERARLARDLHDGPIQGLIALSYRLEEARGLLRRGEMAEAEVVVKGVQAGALDLVKQLRLATNDLRAPETELRTALVEWVSRREESGAPDLPEFDLDLREVGEISPEVSLALYRIAQEGLQNAVKHSRAARVRVVLERLDHSLRLVIEDDGSGFEPPADLRDLVRAEHFGLAGVEEWVTAIGAHLDLRAAPGKGMALTVTVPTAAVATARAATGALPY